MKSLLISAALLIPSLVAAGPCGFVVVGSGGQFKGTDMVDGGLSYRTFIEQDGMCLMRGGDTWHGPCGYGVPAVLTSELTPIGNALEGNWDLDCQAPPTDITGDRFLAVRYTRDFLTGAVTEQLLDPVTGDPLGRPPIIFYKVDK
jgi:hypothetical protein